MRSLLPILLLFATSFSTLYAFPEMSGMTYLSQSETFFAVGDEGHLFELDENLKIIRTVFLGDFDLEAVTSNSDGSRLYCLDESGLMLLEISLPDLSVLSVEEIKKKNKLDKKYFQFESLILIEDTFIMGATYNSEKKGEGVLLRFHRDDLKTEKMADIPLQDISGLAYSEPYFLIISDNADKMIIFSEDEGLLDSLDIQGVHQEGVSLKENDVYILDESGRYQIISNLIRTEP